MGKDADVLREKVAQMRSAITGTVGQARRAASRVGDALPERGEVQNRAMDMMSTVRESPLGLFLGMAAIGFVFGALMPVTRIESERLTPMVDDLRKRAVDRIRNALS
jgi:hypothetical protein